MPANLHILVLEDNMLDAELAIQALDQAGYTCQWDCVETREAFLARLDAHVYDLVISDYNLPMFDGLRAVQLLRQRDPEGQQRADDAIRELSSLSVRLHSALVKAGLATELRR